MKITEVSIPCYVKIQQRSGALLISRVHFYLDCLHLARPSDTVYRLLAIDQEQGHIFSNPLLDNLRVCENCRKRAARLSSPARSAAGGAP